MSAVDVLKVTSFVYGPLAFTTGGKGVFCMSDMLRARIDAMPADELKQANREAWRQLRPLTRAANRERNVSQYGWNDARDHAIDVHEGVCKATYRALARAGGSK